MHANAATQLERDGVCEEDRLRAQLYTLLGHLLARDPSQEVLSLVRGLTGDETELGKAFQELSTLADKRAQKSVSREFNNLFIGMGRGELVPYGSYYLTGFLNEKPLAKLRNAMREMNIKRSDDVKEPEDNIGLLMEMMAGLIGGQFGVIASHKTQREFFENHIASWASHFFKDLEQADRAEFYKPVGTIGRLFMEIEQTAFQME